MRRRALELEPERNTKYRYVSDFDYWLRLGLHGPFARIPQFLARHRTHSTSAGASQSVAVSQELTQLAHEYFTRAGLPVEVRALKRVATGAAYFDAAVRCVDQRALSIRYGLTGLYYHPRWKAPTRLPALYVLLMIHSPKSVDRLQQLRELYWRLKARLPYRVRATLSPFKRAVKAVLMPKPKARRLRRQRPLRKPPLRKPLQPRGTQAGEKQSNRILFVGMAESIHALRWINQLRDTGWDIHLFPSTSNPPLLDWRNITLHDAPFFRPNEEVRRLEEVMYVEGVHWPQLRAFRDLPGSLRIMRYVGDKLWPKWSGQGWRLAETIKAVRPDIVHSLEIQHAGYLVMSAKQLLKDAMPTWIVSNWGSDLYLFGHLDEHHARVTEVIQTCDYYLCECHRDVDLAREFGLNGEVLPVLPVAGGHDLRRMRALRQRIPTSQKRVIMLKGYQHWAGRALVGVRAVELCADVIRERGYEVVIYLPTPDVRIAAEVMQKRTGIQLQVLPYIPYEDLLRWHGRARTSIGLSISDAISTSMLESMILGSFPIQSDSSCAGEWFIDGESGFLVPAEDPQAIAAALQRVLLDDALVDRATEINDGIVEERLADEVIRPQTIALYEHVMANGKVRQPMQEEMAQ